MAESTENTASNPWTIKDFSYGLIDSIEDNLLPEGAAQDCRNFFCEKVGKLSVRKGQERLNDSKLPGPPLGLYSYYNADGTRKVVTVSGSSIYAWDNSKGFNLIKTGLTGTDAQMMFETCPTDDGATTLVGFNGVDNPIKWFGSGDAVDLEGFPFPFSPDERFRYPVYHKDQLFICSMKNKSWLYFSDITDAQSWPSDQVIQVKPGDGDELSALIPFMGELTVFKKRSIHSLRGDDIENFRLDEIDSRVGCVGPKAACVEGNKLFFVSDEGLFVYNGMTARNISNPAIPSLWEKVNKAALHDAVAIPWNGKILFSVPYDKSTKNNMVIVCNPSGSLETFWPMDGINASFLEPFNTGDSMILLSGDSLDGYINKQEVGTDDFGEDISAYWVCKSFDVGVPDKEKKAKKIFMEGLYGLTDQMSMSISLNYTDPVELENKKFDGIMSEFAFPTVLRIKWRYFSPKFYYSGKNGCEVRGLSLPYKAKKKARVRETQT